MESEKGKTCKSNQYMTSNEMPYITYADVESLNRKADGRANNPDNSSTTKIGEHIASL